MGGNCCGDLYALEEALGCETYDGAMETVRAMQEDLDEYADEVETLTKERDDARAIHDAAILDGIEQFAEILVTRTDAQADGCLLYRTLEEELAKVRDHLSQSGKMVRDNPLQHELLDLITLMPDSQTQEIMDYILELRAIRALKT